MSNFDKLCKFLKDNDLDPIVVLMFIKYLLDDTKD